MQQAINTIWTRGHHEGGGRDPPYLWCHQIKRWAEALILVEGRDLKLIYLILSRRVFGIWIQEGTIKTQRLYNSDLWCWIDSLFTLQVNHLHVMVFLTSTSVCVSQKIMWSGGRESVKEIVLTTYLLSCREWGAGYTPENKNTLEMGLPNILVFHLHGCILQCTLLQDLWPSQPVHVVFPIWFHTFMESDYLRLCGYGKIVPSEVRWHRV